jgi:hypothetical protein
MSQFVLVASGVTPEQFQKAIELRVAAKDSIRHVPQGSNSNGVTTQAMTSAKPEDKPETYRNVRFEWDDDGAIIATEIMKALAGK